MRNEAWELAVYQARQIVRGFGEPQSQESEVMAAASVGMAGLALARVVLAAQQLDEAAEALAKLEVGAMPYILAIPKEVQHLLDQAEWERGGALKRLHEQLLGLEPEACPFTFAHTRHWCGHSGCRDA
jgi:hypothetical protein